MQQFGRLSATVASLIDEMSFFTFTCYVGLFLFGLIYKVAEAQGTICDFEVDWCEYEHDATADFPWERYSGSTPSDSTGPTVDHTYGSSSGHYVYTEVTSKANYDKARLLSPVVTVNPGHDYECTLQFWFHMYGISIETLTVYAKPVGNGATSSNSRLETIWELSGNQGTSWSLASVQFDWLQDYNLQIVFEGSRGSSYEGDISLDDISLADCVPKTPDHTPPVISGCPADIDNVILELGSTSGVIVNWTEPTATDDVSGPGSIDMIASHRPTQPFFIGETEVAYIFRDRQGNAQVCLFTVTVRGADTTSPTISNCPDNITTETEAWIESEGIIVSWNEPNATDLSGHPNVIQSHMPNTTFPIGVTVVTYTFVDNSSNTANCSFTVTVEPVDSTPPAITGCPDDFSSITGRHVTWKEPDSYDLSNNVSVYRTHMPGVFFTNQLQVVYTFMDPFLNTAFCNFTISIAYDTTPPDITGCVDNMSVHSELGESGMPVFWTQPSATDDFGRVLLIHASHTSGERFPIGSTDVLYVFADDSYNLAYCNFSVTVETVDTTPPAIQSCPSDIRTDITPGRPSKPVSWVPPTATDTSNNVSLVQSHTPGDPFTAGRTNVVYSFKDGSGNLAKCSFYVTVREAFVDTNNTFVFVDTTPPTIINCPSDVHKSIELGTSELAVSWLEPSAVDVKGYAVLQNATRRPGAMFAADSTTEVAYIFKDESGNLAFCSFDVVVSSVDTTPPEITVCPEDIRETIQIGVANKSISWVEPSASDISGNVMLTSKTHSSGDYFKPGKTRITYGFVDGTGNYASCIFRVTLSIADTLKPKIMNCPSDIVTDVVIGSIGTVVNWTEPSASDESGNVTLLGQTHSPGVRFGDGIATVAYLFMDPSKNVASCTFKIIGNSVDSIPPKVELCPTNIRDTIETNVNGKSITWIEPRASDMSGIVSLSSQSHSSGDLFTPGTTQVTYVFTDGSGNSASCIFEINLIPVDTKKPRIQSCPVDIETIVQVGSIGASVSWAEPSAIDDSGNVTLLAQTHSPGDNVGIGTTTVTYLYADPSNNIAACTFRIVATSVDTNPPQIIYCPSNIHLFTEFGNLGMRVTWDTPTAMDQSVPVISTSSHEPGQLFPVGTTIVSHEFKDSFLNKAACNFTVNITSVDTIPPRVDACPRDINVNIELGDMQTPVSWSEPVASDFSGSVSLSMHSHNAGENFQLGMTDVSYLFIDGTGNQAWCNFSVVVNTEDTTAPTIAGCSSNMVVGVREGELSTSVHWREPSATDESGSVTLLVKTHESGDRFGIGTNAVLYLFADLSNNMASCTFSIEVEFDDTSPPKVLNCPSNINTSAELGISQVPVNWIEPFGIDESSRSSVIQRSHAPGQLFATNSVTQVTYVFGDEAENRATCTFTVSFYQVDTIPPEITSCPSDIKQTIEIGTAPIQVSWVEPRATDNSGHVELQATHSPGEVFDVGFTHVSYIYTDGSNNRAKCKFQVHISESDTQAPSITSCPNDITVKIDKGSFGAIVDWEEPIAEDASGEVMLLVQTHASGTFFTIGTTMVSYIFRDNANNMDKCSFAVSVTAAEASSMVFNCPTNIIAGVEAGQEAATVIWTEPYATNLSAATKISSSHKPTESFPFGSTLVVYKFEDVDGFKQFCNFTVTVTENEYTPQVGNPEFHTRDRNVGSDMSGVSYAALVMSLSIVVFIICIIALQFYVRRKKGGDNIKLVGLQLSERDEEGF